MKILEEGKNIDWKEIIFCVSCGTKFEIVADDIISGTPGKLDFSKYVICPGCNYRMSINTFSSTPPDYRVNIPPHIKKYIISKIK